MPLTDPNLWNLIETWPLPHRIEMDWQAVPARDCQSFEHNLRKIGDWTDESSLRITEAYRRFLYLKALSGKTIKPPRWIDQAWHLHLSFLKNYREFEAAVGRRILHGIGMNRRERDEAYDFGRSLWCSEFDIPPKEDIWPTLRQLQRSRISAAIALLGFCLVVLTGLTGVSERGSLGQILFFLGMTVCMVGLVSAARAQPEKVRRGE